MATPNAQPPAAHVAPMNGRSALTLVMLAQPRGQEAEAYRALRTNVQFASPDRTIRVVGVTSAGTGEGKSTTLANLAVAFAESGQTVIAVDADLRRPSLHTLFGLSNREGLSTAILHEGAPLPLQETGVPGLRVLSSGPLPPNPIELLASKKMDALLKALREQAEIVLLDTPPSAGLSDAATLAPRLDGILLVVGAGLTRREVARRAKEQIERVHGRILGVVLTGVRADQALSGY